MAKILLLPKCPYCKKKISYFGAMLMRTKGEHNCPYCKCISNVIISRAAYALASLVCVSALLIVVLYSIAGDHSSFLGISCVIAPFLIFYIVMPLLVRLVPCKDKSAVKKLLDKAGTNVPSRIVYEKPAQQPVQNPVTLDVEDDFSARFMRAKSTVQKNNLDDELQNDEAQQNIPNEMEDIHNNAVAFEINGNSGADNASDENIPQENIDFQETPSAEEPSIEEADVVTEAGHEEF